MMTDTSTNQRIQTANEAIDTAKRIDEFGVRAMMTLVIALLVFMLWHQDSNHRAIELKFYGDVVDCWQRVDTRLPYSDNHPGDIQLVLESSFDGLKTPPTPDNVFTLFMWK